jgi:acyl carrier protein
MDMQENAALRQGLLQDNISFFSFHLDLLGKTHPKKAQRLLKEVVGLLEAGELRPVETQVEPIADAVHSFQRMSKGQHQGKIVLRIEDGWVPPQQSPAPALFRHGATYLFTGATRGVGLHAAAWAVAQGARNIILTGSSGRAPRHSELLLNSLKKRHEGLEVSIIKLDLSDEAAVRQAFDQYPIRGVFHFATQYTSETSDSVTPETIAGGYSVKADGARTLDTVTRGRDLDIFFMASSLAGLVGNQNQAMYSAANGYLQWLAADRRRSGYPAVALDLPAILGAGRLSQFEHAMELEILTGKGTVPVSVHDLTAWMGKILSAPGNYPAHVSLDGPGWAAVAKGVSRHMRLYEHHIVNKRRRRAAGGGGVADPVKAVREKLAQVLGSKEADVDMSGALTDSGVDSLAAVELMNWINSEFGVSIPQSELLGGLSGEALAAKLPTGGGGGDAGDDDEGGAGPQDPAQVAALVREKVATLLGSKVDDVPVDSPMTDIGVDSLAAVELMNWCNSEYGVSVPQSDLLSGMTLEGLAARLAKGA